ENVDGVQYGIRLLLPPGSLLLGRNDAVLDGSIGEFDDTDLGVTWASPDPLLDEIAEALTAITEEAAEEDVSPGETYLTVRAATFAMLGRSDHGVPEVTGTPALGGVPPHLTEAWFCCAEPTSSQLDRVIDTAPRIEWIPIATPITLRTRGR
ncbi:MAG TPA: hypothetical protein VG368_01805, partial [Acidimicrobiales bacterium]|nr:hypothetical protein [Acidimicrobiales bacterium]